MATKKMTKAAQDAKDKVNKVLNQAKDTVKLLEGLNLVESAKTFVKIPDSQKEKALATLRKLGVATQEEVQALRARIEKLEAAQQVAASNAQGNKTSDTSAEALP